MNLRKLLFIYFLLISTISFAQDCTVNDFCEDALPLSGTGCNTGATSTGEFDSWTPDFQYTNEYDCNYDNYKTPCDVFNGDCIAWNAIQNSVWYTFTIDASTLKPFSIEILEINCSGGFELLQLGIWTNNGTCDLAQETLEACATVDGDYTFHNLNLANGDYYLFVDGSASANCTWEFKSEELNVTTECAELDNANTIIPTTACQNETENLLIAFTEPDVEGVWSFGTIPTGSNANLGAVNGSFTPDEAGNYELFFDVDNPSLDCVDESQFTFSIEVYPSYNIDYDLQICSGLSTVFQGFSFNEFSAPETLSGLVTSLGCDSTVTITPRGVNFIEFFETKETCANQLIEIDNNLYGIGDVATVTSVSTTACDTITTYTVVAYPEPDINLPSEFIMTNSAVELNTGITDTIGFTAIWTETSINTLNCTNCFNPTVLPSVNTQYDLFVYNEDGCTFEYTTQVIIPPIIDPLIPTAFSPNRDGINEEWKIVYEGSYTKFRAEVYNRWGKRVFESDSPDDAWDGIEGLGKNPPMGVYMYFVRIESNEFSEPFEDKGTITLVR